jgi:hypothetical protein
MVFILASTHVQLIIRSMRQMENLTKVGDVPCIQFRPKNDNDKIFITIQNGSGCSAYVYNIIFLIKSERKFFFFDILGWIS